MKTFLVAIGLLVCAGTVVAQSIKKQKITGIENFIAASKNEVLVINFWATFCKPCIAEMPGLIRVTNKYKKQNVKLLLVSLDLPSAYPEKIAAFVKAKKITAPVVWLNETNADYFCPKIDSGWSGSIPATLIINTKTGYRKFFEEEMDAVKFEAALVEVMNGELKMSE